MTDPLIRFDLGDGIEAAIGAGSPSKVLAMPTNSRTDRIRDLNDTFRTTLEGGKCLITSGVSAEGPEFSARAIAAVRSFTDFSADNDPYGEHDFGSLSVGEQRLFWKIDYYDLTLQFGSRDPADPSLTMRVLTIMLAEEY